MDLLFSKNLIILTGFICGFIYAILIGDYFDHPFSSVIIASIKGIVSSIGSSLCNEYMPTLLKPILPILLIIVTYKYYLIKSMSKNKKVSVDNKTKNDINIIKNGNLSRYGTADLANSSKYMDTTRDNKTKISAIYDNKTHANTSVY
jgi:hypothetical protein